MDLGVLLTDICINNVCTANKEETQGILQRMIKMLQYKTSVKWAVANEGLVALIGIRVY